MIPEQILSLLSPLLPVSDPPYPRTNYYSCPLCGGSLA